MDFFYLSQLLKRPVTTRRSERVARIKDLVARIEALNPRGEMTLQAYPPISGLVVEIAGRDIFIPWNQVEQLGPEGARLASATINMQSFERREGEVLLARDVLDKQLIDIDGRRVIRANDLQLYRVDGDVRLTAVDVSVEGIVRRLSFGRMFPGRAQSAHPALPHASNGLRRRRTAPARLINWADVEPLKAGVPDVRLRLSHERLALLHPVDIAHIADDLSYHQGAEIIESLDDERAAETLQEMDEERQADIVEGMDEERAADILEEMAPDDAADLLADLDEVRAEDLLRRMDRDEAEDVEELLAYREDSAGGIMTSDFITFPAHITVDETIAFMRGLEDEPDIIDYLYIVEEEDPARDWAKFAQECGGKLIGVVTLRDLLFANGDRRLSELMSTDYVWINVSDSAEHAARMMAEYNLIALPVLDDDELIRGVITVDDAMEVLLPERWLKRLPRVFT